MYGYLPYWEMTPGITDHLARVDLTTLALFSVTNKSGGAIDTTQKGYEAIVGPLGEQLIREAHDRGVRVELVYSSFGTTRNKRLFGVSNSPKTQAKLIDGLVALAGQLKVDGINVDVEVIDAELIDAYGGFVGRPPGGDAQGSPEEPGLGRHHRQRARLGDGPGRLDGRRRPDLPHGLRLPLVGLRAWRLVADRPP